MQNFRAAFEPIAREVVLVDTGAMCSEIYTPELFTKVRRPVWPLDPIPDPIGPMKWPSQPLLGLPIQLRPQALRPSSSAA